MLRVGDTVQAKLIEEVEKDRWIVSFQGQLLQVTSEANIPFKAHMTLTLNVIRVNPLELKISDGKQRPLGFRVRV